MCPEAEQGPGRARIAITSSQGQAVDLHFGHADQFLIFELGPGDVTYLEVRRPGCTEAMEKNGLEDLDRMVDAVGDCRAVLTMKAGPHARERLEARGILCIEHPGGLLDGIGKVRRLLGNPDETFM